MVVNERIREQLQTWRQDLINLSRTNRLLYFKGSKSTLEILEPAVTDLLQGLAGAGLPFFEPPDEKALSSDPDESSPEGVAQAPGHELRPKEILTNASTRTLVRNALRNLERRTTQEFMDKGLWVLYLGVGMLEWVNVDGDTRERVTSPLLLVPVTLDHENSQLPYRLRRAEEEVAVNPALAAKLDHAFGLSLPGIDEVEDSAPESLFEVVRQLVSEQADWSVRPRVVLGTFSFHKEVMYRDLLVNEGVLVEHSLVRALAARPEEVEADLGFDAMPEDRLDEEAPPEEMVTIRDADASQRKCIVAAREGRSFVMDGPPGTGKSQTIANVVAEVLARGETVLFVSEKAAALEVVHARLQAAHIDEFILALHSHKTTRREVARELGRALAHRPKSTQALDRLTLERLIARRRELSDYALALNETRPQLQRSVHQVLGRIAQLQWLPQAPHPPRVGASLDARMLAQALEAARALARAWAPVEAGPAFLWRDLADPALDAVRQRSLTDILERAEAALTAVERQVSGLAGELCPSWCRSPADADRFVVLLLHLERRRDVPGLWLETPDLNAIQVRAAQLQQLTERGRGLAEHLAGVLGPRWAELRGEDDRLAVDDAVSGLAQLGPEWAADQAWRRGDLAARVAFLGRAGVQLQAATAGAGRIAGAFGLPATSPSLGRIRELAELGQLTGSATPPEAQWLDPSGLAVAEEASRVLEKHVAEFVRHRQSLSDVFVEKVLELDLQGLCVRFETVHRGWRKLLPGYWRDRRTLAGFTRSGRVNDDVLARLRDALAWKTARERLAAAERHHGRYLSRYYRQERTDFGALRTAMAEARRAIELVGPSLDQAALRRELTHAEGADRGLTALSRELVSSVDAWLREAKDWLGDRAVTGLAASPVDAAMGLCSRASALLTTVSEVVDRATVLAGHDLPLSEVRTCLPLQVELTSIQASLEADGGRDRALLGPAYVGLGTRWEDIFDSLRWTQRLRELLGDGGLVAVDQGLFQRLLRTPATAPPLAQALDHWHRLRDAIAAEFRDPYRQDLLARMDCTFGDGRLLLIQLRETVDHIAIWEAFVRASDALLEAGLEPTIGFCVERRVESEAVVGIIERAMLEKWSDEIIRSDRRLQHIRAQDRDHFVREFQELDRDFVRLAAGRVIESCNARRPATTAGPAGIILHEAQKQRKHMPVQKLLAATRDVAQALKPCFMMSPLTVSQFLPPSMRFDVVIFDEASQVRPADAMNCIYRGHRLIVAGDQKQLPPTTFFETVALDGDDEWEEDAIPDFESVLDLCQAHGFPSLTLRWHYRSQHEDLITFSNYSFYEGRLLTFPGAQERGPDLGVELFRVPGIYRRGGARDNPVEANKVVERVAFHALNHPHLSLGVVAFSEAQATAIEDALEMHRTSKPELQRLLDKEDRLRGFFVKNLETVQGDERDILVFSIGYGRDENGKFTMQFGPVNRKGGERRLNVAVTRARRRVEVVSSVGAEEFVGEPGSDGVRHLRRYLDFASRAHHKVRALAIDTSASARDAESPFEEEVARVVRSWGFEVVPQVGCAGYRVDLAVRHPAQPGLFALGIECDGAAYHSSRVARDRDRLRQEVLTGLDWRLHRIWGPSWYRSRGEQEVRLRTALETAIRTPLKKGDPPAPHAAPAVELVRVDLDGDPPWTVPYKIGGPGRPRVRAEMHEEASQVDLQRMIVEVVAVEGPVCEDLVLRRVREAWGVQRAGARIRSAFDRAVRSLTRRRSIRQDNGRFLCLPGSEPEVVRRATPDPASRRDVTEVPVAELDLAVRMLVKDARAITWEELTTRVARLFGWNRKGPDITQALDAIVQALLHQDALVSNDGMLKPGGSAT